ncbi:polysaccharide biosynthesis protein [Arthrobacter antibioticus]|uniref:polysaccharide biosynthesis protein n=1 Tax=Arthrobacter sp. H35-MC1 TaxID=3046203 RepID=UPI0024BA98E1|nr:polysaccharide biosynthesis protein [Arthrobacter sp. H35-MC1]MDJ0316479.1 polysaccharide biosynthesis protein [Arthrobacter sp. H35-MC1]
MKTVLLRLSGFTILPLLSLVTPLLLLPVISGFVGGQGVSSVMTGQAIGTFATTVIMWGWNVDGPVAIARTEHLQERSLIYLSSIRTRLTLMAAVIPITIVVTGLAARAEFRSEAISMALASAFIGMSPAWFCIGLGQPRLLAIYDTIPRFLATMMSIPLLLWTSQLWTYTCLLGVATAISLCVFHRKYSPAGNWFPSNFRRTFKEIRSQTDTAGINVANSSYAFTAVPIATATTTAAASGSLATADTLYRFGLFSVISLGNALQAWVLERNAPNSRHRQLLAMYSHFLLGVLGAVILTLLGPAVSEIVFAGQVRADRVICFYYGIAFAFISASQPLVRNLLIPAGKSRLVLTGTVAAAAVGISGMIAAGVTGHTEGIALSMAASEFVLFIALFAPAIRLLKGEYPTKNSPSTTTEP